MNIQFPVFVLAKDCGEVTRFESVDEMQRELERIDVENDEYAAWDCTGQTLELKTQQSSWLRLEPKEHSTDGSLVSALEQYAAKVGVALKLGPSSPEEVNKAYAKISARVQKRGWFSRLGGRLDS